MTTSPATLLRGGELVQDPWTYDAENGTNGITDGHQVVPFARYLELGPQHQRSFQAISVTAGDDLAQVGHFGARFTLICLVIDSFADGRVYSRAALLRERHGYCGEIRAIGDVGFDQIPMLKACGVNSFAIRDPPTLERLRADIQPAALPNYRDRPFDTSY